MKVQILRNQQFNITNQPTIITQEQHCLSLIEISTMEVGLPMIIATDIYFMR